jgi:hypothetical protein
VHSTEIPKLRIAILTLLGLGALPTFVLLLAI